MKIKEIETIVKSMSLREKIGQLNQPFYGWEVWTRNEKNEIVLTDLFKQFVEKFDGVGAIYGLMRADPWSKINYSNGFTKVEKKQMVSLVQNYLLDHTRLKIKTLISEETPHGHQSLYSVSFPPNITVGNSFDLKLYGQVIDYQKTELISNQINLALMSGLDICYDRRWGRTEECYSEDPFLARQMVKTAICHMQDHEKHIGVVAKHCIAYGAGLEGKNGLNCCFAKRELCEIYFQTLYQAIDDQVDGLMVAYNEIDGMPCVVNYDLLTNYIRKELNYTGIFMGDGLAIDGLTEKYNHDWKLNAQRALEAGISLSLWDESFKHLEQLIANKMLDEKIIDQRVFEVLALKNKLNLLDPNLKSLTEMEIDEKKGEQLDVTMACSSAVLLKNENKLLPLAKHKWNGKTVLIVGDDIDNFYMQMGDYTGFQKKEQVVSYREGLQLLGKQLSWRVNFISWQDLKDIDSNHPDLCIALCGGTSERNFTTIGENGAVMTSKTKKMTSGEGVDSVNLDLPNLMALNYEHLSLFACPVIAIVNQGKPYVLTDLAKSSSALLNMWYPGAHGGEALKNILLGNDEPSGRLAYTLTSQSAITTYRYNNKNVSDYQYYNCHEAEVLYPFGFGLGYGEFCTIKDVNCKIKRNSISITGLISNHNASQRSEVLQVYLVKRNCLYSQRVKELKGFCKIKLRANGNDQFNISISFDAFKVYDNHQKLIWLDLDFTVILGYSSNNILLSWEGCVENQTIILK